jgi:hypothetical protein
MASMCGEVTELRIARGVAVTYDGHHVTNGMASGILPEVADGCGEADWMSGCV